MVELGVRIGLPQGELELENFLRAHPTPQKTYPFSGAQTAMGLLGG